MAEQFLNLTGEGEQVETPVARVEVDEVADALILPIVVAYYAWCMAQLLTESAPQRLRKGSGRYPQPVALLARLGVDVLHEGRGLGAGLLRDVFARLAGLSDELSRARAASSSPAPGSAAGRGHRRGPENGWILVARHRRKGGRLRGAVLRIEARARYRRSPCLNRGEPLRERLRPRGYAGLPVRANGAQVGFSCWPCTPNHAKPWAAVQIAVQRPVS